MVDNLNTFEPIGPPDHFALVPSFSSKNKMKSFIPGKVRREGGNPVKRKPSRTLA